MGKCKFLHTGEVVERSQLSEGIVDRTQAGIEHLGDRPGADVAVTH
jgi:hypothetical protein